MICFLLEIMWKDYFDIICMKGAKERLFRTDFLTSVSCGADIRGGERRKSMAILETENLKKIYGSGAGEVRALDGINMSVETGEFVAVVGSSGSGKSTLLHMLGGLDRPTSGKVFVDDRDIFSLKDEALTIFRRRKIGFVFQAYNLVPVLNVYENIVLPVELDGRKIDSKYISSVTEMLGISSKLGEPSGTAIRRTAAEGGDRKSTGDEACDPAVR